MIRIKLSYFISLPDLLRGDGVPLRRGPAPGEGAMGGSDEIDELPAPVLEEAIQAAQHHAAPRHLIHKISHH